MTEPPKPFVPPTINGLSPRALQISMWLHNAIGIVRQQTIYDAFLFQAPVNATNGRTDDVTTQEAIAELQEMGFLEICRACDCVITAECDGCGEHSRGFRTRHLPSCDDFKRKPPAGVSGWRENEKVR